MLEIFKTSPPLDKVRFVAFVLFLTICLLSGGASRPDLLSHIPVRVTAIVVLAISLYRIDSRQLTFVRIPLVLLLALAGLIAVQLIPLPPGLWASLPGRAPYVDVARITETSEVWRPLALSPDLALNSCLALLPPLAVVLGLATLPSAFRYALLPWIVGGSLLGAFVGLLQITQGYGGGLYFYRITNVGYPVGFFANRNHQALLLAMTIPMLALWATLPVSDAYRVPRHWLAIGVGAVLIPLILVAGSRAGLATSVFGMFAAYFIAKHRGHMTRLPQAGPLTRLSRYAPLAAGMALTGASFYLSRVEAFDRLFGENLASETRYVYFPTLIRMAWDYFPVGSGFGSFETVFRMYEPEEWLSPFYLNHAHNDLLEFLIESGAAGLTLLLVFLVWFILSSVKVWRASGTKSDVRYGRLASVLVIMAIGASLVDYPLRTPVFSVLMAICFCWIGAGTQRTGAAPQGENEKSA